MKTGPFLLATAMTMSFSALSLFAQPQTLSGEVLVRTVGSSRIIVAIDTSNEGRPLDGVADHVFTFFYEGPLPQVADHDFRFANIEALSQSMVVSSAEQKVRLVFLMAKRTPSDVLPTERVRQLSGSEMLDTSESLDTPQLRVDESSDRTGFTTIAFRDGYGLAHQRGVNTPLENFRSAIRIMCGDDGVPCEQDPGDGGGGGGGGGCQSGGPGSTACSVSCGGDYGCSVTCTSPKYACCNCGAFSSSSCVCK